MNCWEFMNCRIEETCPAYPDNGLDCWKKTGTKCKGGSIEKASVREKIEHCRDCQFYIKYANKF